MTAYRVKLDRGAFQAGIAVPDIARELNLPGDTHSDLIRQLAREYQVMAEAHTNRLLGLRTVTETWRIGNAYQHWLRYGALRNLPFPSLPDVSALERLRWREQDAAEDSWTDVADPLLVGEHLIAPKDGWPWESRTSAVLVEVSYTAGLAASESDALLLQSAVSAAVRHRIHGGMAGDAAEALIATVRPAYRIVRPVSLP